MAARLAKLAEKRTAAMNDGEPRYEQFRLIQEFVEALHRPGSA